MKLLVSVRSAWEAKTALAGGADLIDVKEPARGSLGRADHQVIDVIVRSLDGRAPVSAAMGELKDNLGKDVVNFSVDYLKFGLAGCRHLPWREQLLQLRESHTATVVVASYADSDRAEAPSLDEAANFAMDHHFAVLLIDTFVKDGRSLFDWVSEQRLDDLVEALHRVGIELALAGSLTIEHWPKIQRINPDWLAVRGAVCRQGDRTGEIAEERVKSFKRLLGTSSAGESSPVAPQPDELSEGARSDASTV
jgi:(5-formylfuran-3-yl)methyl phosphate synthase